MTIFQRHLISTVKWQYSSATTHPQWSDNIPASPHIQSEVTISQRHLISTVKWQYSSAITYPQRFMNFIQLAVAELWSYQVGSISGLCDFRIWRPLHFLAALCEKWGLPSTSASDNGQMKRSSRKSICKNGTAFIVKYVQQNRTCLWCVQANKWSKCRTCVGNGKKIIELRFHFCVTNSF
jgi:hypothetical protein